MYVVMKAGKYFTGEVARNGMTDFLWTRHLSGAKIWKEKRAWARLAAGKWGGEVVEVEENKRGRATNHRWADTA